MTVIRTFTTADESYDGFGTRTIRAAAGSTRRGDVVRLVETPDVHAEWQRARYASGLHLAIDHAGWRELLEAGLAVGAEQIGGGR